MRKDMAKKLCERPRVGSGYERAQKGRMKIRVQDLDVYEEEDGTVMMDTDEGEIARPMSRRRYGNKELNENLKPLYRFVDAQVNRPWDKVYSEIREHVRVDSAVQLHILQHLDFYVEGQNGGLYEDEETKRIYREDTSILRRGSELMPGDLYVHPRTGILRRYNKKKQVPKRLDKDIVREISSQTFYCKINGFWYEVRYSKPVRIENFTKKFFYFGHPDFLVKKVWNFDKRTYVPSSLLEYSKRQLPKNILKKYGLKNERK
jgi:hypothetical protein